MGKIWEFFEHLDEYVYVSDPETNQLVYMNQKALKSYGFQSKEEIVGLKCYEVLQGNSAPCSICNNEQLRPGYFKEWEYYNPVVKTDFCIKDTLVEDCLLYTSRRVLLYIREEKLLTAAALMTI